MFYTDIRQRGTVAEYDQILVWLTVLLLGLGTVMVYSASIAIAEGSRFTGYQPTYYLSRHGMFVAISLALAIVAFQVPTRWLQRAAPYLFMLGLVLLALVLVPGIGREVNGSRRWLPLYFFNLQPSELMKVFAVLYAADYTLRKAAHMNSVRRGFMPMFCVMLLTGGLLLSEPDFGALAVITAIAMGILFLGGMNWRLFAGLIVMLVAGFVLLILTSPYRMQRVVGSTPMLTPILIMACMPIHRPMPWAARAAKWRSSRAARRPMANARLTSQAKIRMITITPAKPSSSAMTASRKSV